MLLVLVSKPLDACGRKFVVGGACGCVEAYAMGKRNVGDCCCGVYIRVGVTLCHVHVEYVMVFQ